MSSIRVRTAHRAAFWRAGRQWGPLPVVVDTAELSEEQLAALRAEPRLIVEDVPEGDQDGDGIPDSKDRDQDRDGKHESRPKRAVPAKAAKAAKEAGK